MNQLLAEINDMPDNALELASGVSEVWTPQHLVPLREVIRKNRGGELGLMFGALQERFPQAGAHFGVFQAAAEMALMERVARDELPASDQRLLRQLWEALGRAA